MWAKGDIWAFEISGRDSAPWTKVKYVYVCYYMMMLETQYLQGCGLGIHNLLIHSD